MINSGHAISPKFPFTNCTIKKSELAQVINFMLSPTKQEIGKSQVFAITVALSLRLSLYNQLQSSNPIDYNKIRYDLLQS